MAVLIDHHRVDFLGPIVKQFGQELNERLGFTEAAITSARGLSEPERHSLEAEVEKLTGRKVLARYSEDATILGGAIVRIGSTIYDGSVKGTLERIRERLSST
jgi:F-type H+-transporting ATPase subunit delta